MALNNVQQAAVRKEAAEVDIPADFALGIVDKESAGRAFYKVGKEELPAIRIEGHYVYKLTSGAVREAAIQAGLAAQKSGVVKNSNTMAGRYTQLNRLIEIVGHEIAYQSISIGIGQIMGTNHEAAGYESATAMFQAATASFDNQVDQMLAFIANTPKALKAAQRHDYKAFALVYNGPKAKQSYWEELETFVKRYSGDAPANDNTNPVLERIKALGYNSVMEFQSARGIKVDGIIGKITTEHVEAAEAAIVKVEQKPIKDAVKAGGAAVATGATTIVAANPDIVAEAVKYIDPITGALKTLAPLGTTVILIGVGLVLLVAGYTAFKNWKR